MIRRRFLTVRGLVGLSVVSGSLNEARKVVAEDPKQPETVVPLNRDVPRHKQFKDRAKQENVELLFIGESITQGWKGAGKDVWKARYEPRYAMNAGIGGDRKQHVLWRIENGNNIDGLRPKAAVLMIGTNNMGANSTERSRSGSRR